MSFTLREFTELDEHKKDAEWANTVVTYLRQHMQPVINQERAREGMEYLFAEYGMDSIRKMFRDPDKAGVSFRQLGVMEKVRNVFIAEMMAMGVIINVQAVDPTADEDKQHDQGMLKRRRSMENLLGYVYGGIGEPAPKLADEEKRTGKKPYKGNVGDFDKMGLDDQDPEDISFFMEHFHRFDHEIALGDAIQFLMTYNEIDELISYWVNDILGKKAIAGKIYVSDDSGAVKMEYLAPETVYALQGRKKDFKDAICIAYEQSVTIHEMIEIIGNDFDHDRDMQELLSAVNYAYKTEYTGVHIDGRTYFGEAVNMCSYSQFMQFKVGLGYIEWKSINAKSYKVTDNNSFGNFSMFPIPYSQNVTEDSRYRKENEYQQCTYKSYYLTYSPTAQHLYKFGKLNYQHFEGAEDQISNFSIVIYKEVGKTAVEIARPFIDFLEKNFKKFEYMVVRAKPPGRAYNYESLVQIAQKMFPTSDQRVGVNEVLSLFYESANEVYTLPEINGQPVGGGTNVNYDINHGLSKSIIEFKNNIDWAFAQINSMIGISPLRDAYSPQPREAMGLQEKALDYSEHATYYIPRMISFAINKFAVRGCMCIQDIVTFKDRNTVPYNFFTRALGFVTVDKLTSLGRIAMHRYGIFVESLDQAKEKAQNLLIYQKALDNKAITPAQFMLIKDEKSPKKAFLTFAFMENRNTKIAQKNAMQLQQQQQQGQMQLEQAKQQTEQMKTQGKIAVENVKGEWFYKAHAYGIDIGLQKKEMELQVGPHVQADANIREDNALNGGGGPAVQAMPSPPAVPAPAPAQQGMPVAQPPQPAMA